MFAAELGACLLHVNKQMETRGSEKRSALTAHTTFPKGNTTFTERAGLIDCYRTIDSLKAAGFYNSLSSHQET